MIDKGCKKKKKYMKINLFETSVVGIPAYPDAHFSLMKALHEISERRAEQMTETNAPAVVETKAVEVKEVVAKAEEVVETKAETKVEVTKETEEVKMEKFLAVLEKAIGEAVEKVTVKRGLIEAQKDIQEKAEKSLKDLSVGELAIKSGFFK